MLAGWSSSIRRRRLRKILAKHKGQVRMKAPTASEASLIKCSTHRGSRQALEPNNAFTSTLVLRLFGSLVAAGVLKAATADIYKKPWTRNADEGDIPTRTIAQIAIELSSNVNNLQIKDYPPAAAVVYWFVDGVANAELDLGENWNELVHYASAEFRKQRSLVVARHTAMMDPVAMAMAACLCARLHSLSTRADRKFQTTGSLPTTLELESAIIDLFQEQTPSGLWPKYFPLFHYDDAGSNFCYTFEMLEAILLEFGNVDSTIFQQTAVVEGFEKAVSSCVANRLVFIGASKPDPAKIATFCGWNSGGYLKTLQKGQPESWATAVVHMFLHELISSLSRHIRQQLFEKYGAKLQTKKFSDLLDVKVQFPQEEQSLKLVLEGSLVRTFSSYSGEKAEQLLDKKIKGPVSALLFGPPGTSKTEVAKAIAGELSWPLVEIDPSHFLRTSYQNIYIQAEVIFTDVTDMYGAVVLFDELDALVKTREGSDGSDTESTFLTTYMLPKLAKLHDRRKLIFLMATNYIENFDPAIKRPGRFDKLLCMGPPTFLEKASHLETFYSDALPGSLDSAGKRLLALGVVDDWTYAQLNLLTFGEFGAFINDLAPVTEISNYLETVTNDEFQRRVLQFGKTAIMRAESLSFLKKPYDVGDQRQNGVQTFDELYSVPLPNSRPKDSAALRYLIERRQSKNQ